MNWWEWVFSGIGASVVVLVIQWWRSRPSGQNAAITAQGASVHDSPVASGSDIVQTITHNHYPPAVVHPPAANPASDPQQENLESASLSPQRAREISVQLDSGIYYEASTDLRRAHK